MLQGAESTLYGCQVVPGPISAVIGSKPTTREMTIPVPTFGHTPLVGGNLESGYDEATTNIKGRTWDVALRKRFYSVDTAVWAVCPRLRGAAVATVHSRKLRFLPHSANYFG